jgi:L-asparaginase
MTSEPILVLTTGGTIDKQYFDALSEYQITESVIARLLEVARVRYPFRIEEIMRKDSLEVGEADRGRFVERVLTAAEARIVITHGTDTMVVHLNKGLILAPLTALLSYIVWYANCRK